MEQEYKIWEKENSKIIKNVLKNEKNIEQIKDLFKSAFNCGYNTGYVNKEKELAKKKWEEWNQK